MYYDTMKGLVGIRLFASVPNKLRYHGARMKINEVGTVYANDV